MEGRDVVVVRAQAEVAVVVGRLLHPNEEQVDADDRGEGEKGGGGPGQHFIISCQYLIATGGKMREFTSPAPIMDVLAS